MAESWVTVGRYDDFEEADWVAARLREADVPAVVHEGEADAPVEVRVEADHADEARRILAAESEEAAPDPDPEPDPPDAAAPHDGGGWGDLAMTFAFVLMLPPLGLLNLWTAWRAARHPDPADRRPDPGHVAVSAAATVVGLALWYWFILPSMFTGR